VEPTRHRLPVCNRAGFTSQNEERCLEGVLGVMRVVEDAKTCSKDHRNVPPHKCILGSFVLPGDKAFQPLTVAGALRIWGSSHFPEVLDDTAQSTAGHRIGLLRSLVSIY
jgi:hypothetical protein